MAKIYVIVFASGARALALAFAHARPICQPLAFRSLRSVSSPLAVVVVVVINAITENDIYFSFK